MKPHPNLNSIFAFAGPLREAQAVLDHGDAKPGREPGDWADTPRDLEDDLDHLIDHVVAYARGEKREAESGRHHLAHVVDRCLIIMFHEKVGVEP